MDLLTIGQLARQVHVNRETIRYCERRNLMLRPLRSVSGYRLFSDNELERLRFIKDTQALGFSLNEIRELLDLRLSERSSCEELGARAARKLADVEAKIAALERLKSCSGRASRCLPSTPSNSPVSNARKLRRFQ